MDANPATINKNFCRLRDNHRRNFLTWKNNKIKILKKTQNQINQQKYFDNLKILRAPFFQKFQYGICCWTDRNIYHQSKILYQSASLINISIEFKDAIR